MGMVARREIRARQGRKNALAGAMAEDSVAQRYSARGADLLARRHRSPGGEIDIVARQDDILIFVEVKRRGRKVADSSPVAEFQWQRLEAAANHYILSHNNAVGDIAGVRFDVAVVGESGLEIIENARSFEQS